VREEGRKEVKLLRATVVLQEVEPLCWSHLSPPKQGLNEATTFEDTHGSIAGRTALT
jgi:hypothetical protein